MVRFCLLAIRKMINDARNEVELSAHPAVARATEWSETRPTFRVVFRHAGVVPLGRRSRPQKFHHFFAVETTCDDVEHTWREQVREKSAVLLATAKAYVVNDCRLGNACKILIKVRYLAKRSYLTNAFFPSLAETNVALSRFLKREFFNLLKHLHNFFYLRSPSTLYIPVEMRFDTIFTANSTINFSET